MEHRRSLYWCASGSSKTQASRRLLLKLLAIDLGTNLGWSHRDADNELVSGVLSLTPNKKASKEIRWVVLYRWLTLMHTTQDFEEVVYEQPGRLFGHAKKVLPGLQAIIELWAAQNGVSIKTCSPSTLKKFATGDGTADKTMMEAAAALRWPGRKFERHDEIDALFVLTYFEKKHVRKAGDKKLPEAQSSGN